MTRRTILWLRRDLRLHDHPALAEALASADEVVPLFVLDDVLLGGRWPAPNRVWFMLESVAALAGGIEARGGTLVLARGRPAEVVPAVARTLDAVVVHATRDATPYGRRRDEAVMDALAAQGVELRASPGLYVHEPDTLRTADGRPFTVYSPFRRAWEAHGRRDPIPAPDRVPGPSRERLEAVGLATRPPALPELGLRGPTADVDLLLAPGEPAARARLDRWLADGIDRYAETRDRLDLGGTSRLSQDLRFGLLSALEVADRAAGPGAGRRTFEGELAWRDFYADVLWHRPELLERSFQPAFDRLDWRDDPDALAAWAEGRTGYPVVDAALRQLRRSGFVHNRARMVAASFLTKHLLVDRRLGERVFMEHLVDGDIASNDGGWQWAASTGTDPQPWFRIFNPVLQGRRHDPDGEYVRRWVPELARVPTPYVHQPWMMPADVQSAAGCVIGRDYPAPIVDHAVGRQRALAAFSVAQAAYETRRPSQRPSPRRTS